ncbi:hypothetical protein TWF696_005896 [Orbilia brochopaga]|uniref:SUN domain-containing protein n=1 Tax=Orbilia brochopaga TaxID=3140254 RepID=A0AAV9UYJ3_9PEZI
MKRTCWLFQLLLLLPLGGTSLSLSPTVTRSTGAGGFGVSTCPFRTANYITHGLPQQCLRASRVSSQSANATGRRELSDAAADANGNAASLEESPSLNTDVVDLATTTSIDFREKFERDKAKLSSSSSSSENDQQPPEDAETPIDTAKFLSFEEWKAQNLAKAGQSAENFGERPPKEARRRPGAVPSALDALGEDAEIDLNFDGGENEDGSAGEPSRHSEKPPSEPIKPDTHIRSKDAGKTCKERFNYASFDCAATVHRTNPESKGASAILVENKDSYMLNKCGAKNKFLIVELCDDILVDTVVLANYEFFSSMFRTFRVSVSDRYPVKSAGWKDLGVFEARNTREIQAFLIQSPLIWARYLRIDFLTHYGKEFYCPISLLRVHGTTMMEEFRHQEEAARGYHEDDSEDIEPEAVAEPIEEKLAASKLEAEALAQSTAEDAGVPPSREMAQSNQSTQSSAADSAGPAHADPTGAGGSAKSEADQSFAVGSEHQERDVKTTSPTEQTSSVSSAADETAPSGNEHTITSSPGSERAASSSKPVSKPPKASANDASHTRDANLPRDSSSTVPESPRHPSPASVAAPTPTTQESFFKTIHKRLQLLEANATLSLQYIEEQSRLMRDTFSKMEKRQFNKSASYLDQLNATVFRELREFRMQYDQLWQSTVIALDTQRELSEREILAISARLTLLADEVVFQKRMTIAQSFLMILVVCIVVFTKTQNLDVRFARMVSSSRGQEHLVLGLESPPTSPSPPPARTRGKQSAKKRMREYAHAQQRHQRRDSSDLETGGGKKRTPIPKRFYAAAAAEGAMMSDEGSVVMEPVSPPLEAQVTQSSPATPSGGMRRVKEREGAWVPASASDGEYAPDIVRERWRATSPLSRQVTSECDVDVDDDEPPDVRVGESVGALVGDCEVDSYFLNL